MGQTRTVIKVVLAVVALAAPMFFPLGVTVFLTACGAVLIPLLPLAVGLVVDALYWSGSGLPVASLAGALASLAALFVHRFIKTSIIYA